MNTKLSTQAREKSHKSVKGSWLGATRSKISLATLSAIFCCAAPFQQAAAELPDMSVFANSQELSDEFLGQTRGKFVSAGQIMNFGVKMVTEWVTSSGEVINAAGNLTIDMSSGRPQAHFEPVISVQHIQPLNNNNASSSNNVVNSGQGLGNVTGVVQSIQVAGNTNGIGNAIGISVKRFNNNTPHVSNNPTASNLHVTTASGNNANVSLANNGISVGINVVDQGQASQAIRSVSQGSGQVLQSVSLSGNLNQIRNMISLDIHTRNNTAGFGVNRMQVLSSLREIRNATPF